MKAYKTTHQGNPNIGLFIFANDKICIASKNFREDQLEEIEKTLQVPLYTLPIAGTDLLGLFLAGNNKGIIAPSLMFDYEKEKLKEICAKHKINLAFLNTELTALGNNLVCNDNGCMGNHEFEKNIKEQIEGVIEVKVRNGKIADLEIVGSLSLTTNKGCLISEDALDEEIEELETLLKCKVVRGTINSTPHIRSGLVANSNGFVLSESSLGEEVLHITEAFE